MVAVKSSKCFKVVQLVLRSLVLLSTLAAAWITITSKEKNTDLEKDIKFTYSPALVFFAGTNILACVYAVMSLVVAIMFNFINYFVLLVFDMVVMTLAAAGGSAAVAVGYVALFGNDQAYWAAVCDYVHKYCNKMIYAMLLSFGGAFCCLCLAVISGYKSSTATKFK